MGPSDKTSTQEYDGIVVQSSLKGISIPKGWGTNKFGCNLVDYLDFNAKKVSQGGKGGPTGTSYDYHATLLLGICQGPISGVRTIYKDSAIFTATASGSKEVNGTTITVSSQTPIQAAGLTALFQGAIGQAPWSYLTSAHADHALGYSGLAYAAAENYDLNASATTPNHNFEVQFPIRSTVNGVMIDDATAAEIIPDFLPAVPRWPANGLNSANISSFETYCLAQGIFLSPIASDGRQASDLLTELLQASNTDCHYSDGQLWFTPYGDTAITNNGVTWTPDLTPRYNIGWGDILPSGKGEDPIQWDINRTLEAYNYVQVGFQDRSQQYASDTATAVDQANINEYGLRRQDPVSLPSICDAAVASTVAQLMVQRSANVRRTCEFKVSELFGLLNPQEDLVTVPLRNGGTRLVRIVEANESEDGTIDVKAEEELVAVSHAAEYVRQDALGQASDFAIDPGDANPPMIINPPLSLTNGALEVWLASSGGPDWGGANVWSSIDDETYQLVGKITQPGRYGVTTTDLPVTTDPDTTTTLGVNLTNSAGTLTSASNAQADAGVTLCAVGTEIIAFSTATLTSANNYNLTGYIRRGQAGTTIADEAVGSEFMRLDDSVAVVPYTQGTVGKLLYVKLQSFNVYGQGTQDLDLCTAYEFTAQQNGTNIVDVDWTALTGVPSLLLDYVTSGGTAVDTAAVNGRASTAITDTLDTNAANIATQLLRLNANISSLSSLLYLGGTPLQTLTQGITATVGDLTAFAGTQAGINETTDGKLSVYLKTGVDSGTGDAFVYAASDSITGELVLAGQVIALLNIDSSGTTLIPAMVVEGGNVYFANNVRIDGSLAVLGSFDTGSLADNSVTAAPLIMTSTSNVYGPGSTPTAIFEGTVTIDAACTIYSAYSISFQDGGGHSASDHFASVKLYIDGQVADSKNVPNEQVFPGFSGSGSLYVATPGDIDVKLVLTLASFDYYNFATLFATGWKK